MIHQIHTTSPFEIFTSLVRNRRLIWQMAKREVVGRYRGSFFGLAWSFFNPLLMLAVYTFFFTVVFKARWDLPQDTQQANFSIVLFVGLIVHGLFAECVNRAPSLIVQNVSYVKRVVFPLEILPWIAIASALFHACISLFVLLLLQLFFTQAIYWTVLLFPLVIAPLILFTMGFSWFLAAIGVFVRDIGQITGMLTAVLMFISPVFFPISALPKGWVSVVMLNPLTLIIEESRKVLLWGQLPDWQGLGIYALVGLLVARLGFWWFQKTRKGFADVM